MSGSYTQDNDLELIASGQADWDTSINANFSILERGHHIKATAGSALNSGQVCSITGSGTIIPFDTNSLSLNPHAISYAAVTSGSTAKLLMEGNVRSMSVWSGHIVPGRPVFAALNSAGFIVSSYAGCRESIGLALGFDSVRFSPGKPRVFPQLVSQVATLGPLVVGSFGDFALPVGNRGIVRDVTLASSHNRMKLRFWSGNSRVDSELLYETLTRSWDPGSADITSTYFRDAALFPQRNTDATSHWFIYGRVDVQSGSGVSSAYVAVNVINERFA